MAFVFCFYQSLSRHRFQFVSLIAFALAASILGVSCIGLLRYLDLGPSFIQHLGFGSTLGNINMTAQAVSLGVISLVMFLVRAQGAKEKWAIGGMIALILVYCLLLGCRSIFIFLFLFSCFLLVRFGNRRLVPWLCGFLIVALGVQFGLRELRSSHELANPETQKITLKAVSSTQTSRSGRVLVWLDSLRMIKDRPFFGIGSKRFELSVLPYAAQSGNRFINHKEIMLAPHNGYLRILVEEGILYGGLLLVFMIGLIWRFLKEHWGRPDSGGVILLAVGLGLHLGVEMMLQFPLDNAVPFLTTSFLIAFLFQSNYSISVKSIRFPVLILVLFGFSSLGLGYVVHRSHVQTFATMNNPERLKEICESLPSAWKSCDLLARAYLRQGRTEEATHVLEEMLRVHPTNAFAHITWSLVGVKTSDHGITCRETKAYKKLLPADTRYDAFIHSQCDSR